MVGLGRRMFDLRILDFLSNFLRNNSTSNTNSDGALVKSVSKSTSANVLPSNAILNNSKSIYLKPTNLVTS